MPLGGRYARLAAAQKKQDKAAKKEQKAAKKEDKAAKEEEKASTVEAPKPVKEQPTVSKAASPSTVRELYAHHLKVKAEAEAKGKRLSAPRKGSPDVALWRKHTELAHFVEQLPGGVDAFVARYGDKPREAVRLAARDELARDVTASFNGDYDAQEEQLKAEKEKGANKGAAKKEGPKSNKGGKGGGGSKKPAGSVKGEDGTGVDKGKGAKKGTKRTAEDLQAPAAKKSKRAGEQQLSQQGKKRGSESRDQQQGDPAKRKRK